MVHASMHLFAFGMEPVTLKLQEKHSYKMKEHVRRDGIPKKQLNKVGTIYTAVLLHVRITIPTALDIFPTMFLGTRYVG